MYRTIKHTIPKKSLTDKSIILDIDETLVYTSDELQDLIDMGLFKNPDYFHLRERMYVLPFNDEKGEDVFWGLARPYAIDFLAFCFKYFKNVIIWSAGTEEYVLRVVKFLCKDLPQPKVIYTKHDCTFVNNKPMLKPLSKIMEQESWLKLSEEKTLFLDDMEHTFAQNKNNAIHIPGFIPYVDTKDHKLNEDETSLKELQNWLETDEVINCEDVRKLDKSKIFSRKSLSKKKKTKK